MYFALGLSLPFSIVLGALAAATAPASTMMTIRQTNSKGDFVDTLLQVVALDDVVGLVAFSVAIAVATASLAGTVTAGNVLLPIVYNIVAFVVGGLLGFCSNCSYPNAQRTTVLSLPLRRYSAFAEYARLWTCHRFSVVWLWVRCI